MLDLARSEVGSRHNSSRHFAGTRSPVNCCCRSTSTIPNRQGRCRIPVRHAAAIVHGPTATTGRALTCGDVRSLVEPLGEVPEFILKDRDLVGAIPRRQKVVQFRSDPRSRWIESVVKRRHGKLKIGQGGGQAQGNIDQVDRQPGIARRARLIDTTLIS